LNFSPCMFFFFFWRPPVGSPVLRPVPFVNTTISFSFPRSPFKGGFFFPHSRAQPTPPVLIDPSTPAVYPPLHRPVNVFRYDTRPRLAFPMVIPPHAATQKSPLMFECRQAVCDLSFVLSRFFSFKCPKIPIMPPPVSSASASHLSPVLFPLQFFFFHPRHRFSVELTPHLLPVRHSSPPSPTTAILPHSSPLPRQVFPSLFCIKVGHLSSPGPFFPSPLSILTMAVIWVFRG